MLEIDKENWKIFKRVALLVVILAIAFLVIINVRGECYTDTEKTIIRDMANNSEVSPDIIMSIFERLCSIKDEALNTSLDVINKSDKELRDWVTSFVISEYSKSNMSFALDKLVDLIEKTENLEEKIEGKNVSKDELEELSDEISNIEIRLSEVEKIQSEEEVDTGKKVSGQFIAGIIALVIVVGVYLYFKYKARQPPSRPAADNVEFEFLKEMRKKVEALEAAAVAKKDTKNVTTKKPLSRKIK